MIAGYEYRFVEADPTALGPTFSRALEEALGPRAAGAAEWVRTVLPGLRAGEIRLKDGDRPVIWWYRHRDKLRVAWNLGPEYRGKLRLVRDPAVTSQVWQDLFPERAVKLASRATRWLLGELGIRTPDGMPVILDSLLLLVPHTRRWICFPGGCPVREEPKIFAASWLVSSLKGFLELRRQVRSGKFRSGYVVPGARVALVAGVKPDFDGIRPRLRLTPDAFYVCTGDYCLRVWAREKKSGVAG